MAENFIINPSSISREAIKSDLESWLNAQPDSSRWKDFFKSQVGQTVVELVAGMGSFIQYNNVLSRREAFWKNATNRSSVIAGATSIGYTAYRGRNNVFEMVVIPNVSGMLNKFTVIGSVRDQDIILLNDTVVNSGTPVTLYGVLGLLNTEEIIIDTSNLSSFRFTKSNVSEDIKLMLNGIELSTSRNMLDLLNQKFVTMTNPLGSLDALYLNTSSFNVTYKAGDKLTLEWVELKNLSFLSSDIKFDLGSIISVTNYSTYQEPESIESIKINSSLYNETQSKIRGRNDYLKTLKGLDTNIVSTSGVDISPAVVELFCVTNDLSLYSENEKNQFVSQLQSIRPFGVMPPTIGNPGMVMLKLKVEVFIKENGDAVSAVNNVINPLEKVLGQLIDFKLIEDSIESNSFVKISRVSLDLGSLLRNNTYYRGDYVQLNSSDEFIYEVTGFAYSSGPYTPMCPITAGVTVEDGEIQWVSVARGPCDLPETWLPNHNYNSGDAVTLPSCGSDIMLVFDKYVHKSTSSVEKQEIAFSGVPASGTFRLEYGDESTVDLSFNSNAMDIQNALNDLEFLSGVVVDGSLASKKIGISFEGADANKSQPLLTLDSEGVDEIQCLEFSLLPNSGQWQLSFDGFITVPLQPNTSATELKLALEQLPNIGTNNVMVTGNMSSRFVITFINNMGKRNVNQLVVHNNTLTSGIASVGSITRLVAGKSPVTGNNEVQLIEFSNTPDSGSFKLEFDQSVTPFLNFNCNAAQIKTALESLTTIGSGNIDVTGNMSNGFNIEFIGALSNKDVLKINSVYNSLLRHVPVSISITASQQGGGGINEVQKIVFDRKPYSGSWSLSFNNGGSKETTDIIVTPDISGSLGGRYWKFNTPNIKYYVWYCVDNNSADPAFAGEVGIRVDIPSNSSVDTVKYNTVLAINSVAGFYVSCISTAADRMRLTNKELGSVADAISGNSGFTILVTVNGVDPIFSTSLLPYNATAEEVKTALEILPNMGATNVEVTGNIELGFIVTFRNSLGNMNVNMLSVLNNSLLNNEQTNINIATTSEGVTPANGVNESQKIVFSYLPDAGSWRLNYNNEETALLPYSASADDVKNALNALSLSDVDVTGNMSLGFIVDFKGADGMKPQNLLILSESSLYASSAPLTINPCMITEGMSPASNLKDASDMDIAVSVSTKVDGINPEPNWFSGQC